MASQHLLQAAETYERAVGGSTRHLAQRIVADLLPGLDNGSVLLDNACGPGIVTSEILQAAPRATVYAVDAALRMVDVSRALFTSHANVRCDLMPGESLAFDDATFDYSITNIGLPFFCDPRLGARQIHRTLKPGGIAVVTTWAEQGYLAPIRQAQHAIRPNDAPLALPIAEGWSDPAHLAGLMKGAGFGDVDIMEIEVPFSLDGLPILFASFASRFEGWSESEMTELKSLVVKNGREAARAFAQSDRSEIMGLPMRAVVAVCKK